MNRKLLLSALTLLLSISLIAVSTMAWFTGSDEAGEALFTMGTVKVSGGEPSILYNKDPSKVNPGDCYVVSWNLKNIGTKRIQLRTKLDFAWLDGLDKDNIYIIPAPVTDNYPYDWVLYQEASDKPVYAYLRGFPDGLPSDEEVELRLIIYFDGEMTDDDYQSEDFALNISVQAVQASNNSPSSIWGSICGLINDIDYSFDYKFWDEYWHDFDPMNIKCYAFYFNDDDPEDPVPDNKVIDFEFVYNPIGEGNDIKIIEENGGIFAYFKVHIKKAITENGKRLYGKKEVKIYLKNCGDEGEESNSTQTHTFHNGNVDFFEVKIMVPSEYRDEIKEENIRVVIDGVTKMVTKDGKQK